MLFPPSGYIFPPASKVQKNLWRQVPRTSCNRARTNSAINNKQASSYIRAESQQRGSGAPVLRHQAPRAVDLLVLRTWPIGQVALAYRRYRGSTRR